MAIVTVVVGVRLKSSSRCASKPPEAELLLLDEWLPLRASAERKGGCERSSETRLGAGGGGGGDGSPETLPLH